MKSTVLIVSLACALPYAAGAQQSVQAQGSASAQGGASVERKDGGQMQSQATATGSGSAAVSSQRKADKPDKGGKTGTPDKADKTANIDSGSTMNAVLSNSVDARKSKPGDPVKARSAEPVKSGGQVVIPKGATLLGHVTQAQASGKGEAQSAVGIAFDRAVLKDGHEIPLNTTIRAIAAAEGAASAGMDSMGSMSGMGSGAASSGGGLGGRGLAGGMAGGGVAGVGGAMGGASRIAGGATGAVGAGVGATHDALTPAPGATGGLNASGMFASSSQGVFGLHDLNLQQATAGSASGSGSVISSAGRNVHLDSGTRMLLSVESATQRGAASGSSAAPDKKGDQRQHEAGPRN